MMISPAKKGTDSFPPEERFENKVMMETSEQLYQTIEQMGRMQRILESYRNEILTRTPRNFAVLAEGPLEQLRQLQQQIDEYIQRLEATGTSART
jgi:hypothetical protein